jgi:hypothetical protein
VTDASKINDIQWVIDIFEKDNPELGPEVRAANSQLTALRASNDAQARQIAALREALAVNKHTDECLRYAADTGHDHCIAECADSRRKALSSVPPSSIRLVTDEGRDEDM